MPLRLSSHIGLSNPHCCWYWSPWRVGYQPFFQTRNMNTSFWRLCATNLGIWHVWKCTLLVYLEKQLVLNFHSILCENCTIKKLNSDITKLTPGVLRIWIHYRKHSRRCLHSLNLFGMYINRTLKQFQCSYLTNCH